MHEAKRRIAYIPYIEPNNAYVSRMQDVLARFGSVEKMVPIKKFLRMLLSGKMRRYDVTFFNWTENDALEEETGKINARKAFRVFLRTVFARLVSRRLVFVRHNTYPHLIHRGQEDAAKRMIDRYEGMFHSVISHSGAEPAQRYRYVPHPLYKRVACGASAAPAAGRDLPREYYVMFGRIVAYKQILEMARAFPENKNLLIIGFVKDEAYGAEIGAVDRPNIFYRPGYLDEAQAQALIHASNGIVLAHAGESTVVSGSFFYAMSLPVPVLAVETPFLRWIAPKVGDDLLVLAPDLDALAQRIGTHAPRELPADAGRRLNDAFGDEAIAQALAPVFSRR
ncbi:MAG: hypothetical protein QM777_24305 [Pseudorhodoferax sp.]